MEISENRRLNLLRVMEDRGISQAALIDATGWKQSFVSNILREGGKSIGPKTVKTLMALFSVPEGFFNQPPGSPENKIAPDMKNSYSAPPVNNQSDKEYNVKVAELSYMIKSLEKRIEFYEKQLTITGETLKMVVEQNGAYKDQIYALERELETVKNS